MPHLSRRSKAILETLALVTPGRWGLTGWLDRQPLPPAEAAREKVQNDRRRLEWDQESNRIDPAAPRRWRVTAPLKMHAAGTLTEVELALGTILVYENRDHQVFYEQGGWTAHSHRFALDDGRRVTFLESHFHDPDMPDPDTDFPPVGLEPDPST